MKRLGDARSRRKKAVSAVVATILIVMITVLAIGIIWVAIIPMIKDNLGSSDVCKDAGVSIISSQGYTCYKPNNITMVQVSKGSTKANVTGLKFSISSGGNSYDYDEQTVAYATTDYDVFYLNTSEFEKIEKISVVPSVKSGDSEKSCSVIYLDDIPLCSSNVNLVAISAGRLIGRSGSVVINNEPACDNSCSCADSKLIVENCTNDCGNICQGTRRDGSILAPFAIYNCTDLNNTRNNLDASYELMSDIDCSETKNWDGGKGFLPIGDSGDIYSNFPTFTGIFDGNSYTISGLFINRTETDPYVSSPSGAKYETDFVGLFVNNGGLIKNLKINNADLEFVGYGGIISSYNAGVIEEVQVESSKVVCKTVQTSIYSDKLANCGGLVYQNGNSGIISRSSVSSTSINGSGTVGGLVSLKSGLIEDSYSFNVILFGQSLEKAGSLVGLQWIGNILNSYSYGSNVPLIGNIGGGLIENSFNTQDSLGNKMGVLYGNTPKVNNSYYLNTNPSSPCFKNFISGETTTCTPLADINYFKDMNNAPLDSWDFENTWVIDSTKNEGYPKLKWQN